MQEEVFPKLREHIQSQVVGRNEDNVNKLARLIKSCGKK